MAIETGAILKGKITGITKFGAFVELEGGRTGMVHISEVASAYVKEIGDFVKLGQELDVKVIRVSDDGKISLSIKQAASLPADQPRQNRQRPQLGGYQKPQPKPDNFDDMLSKFMQSSNEKINSMNKGNSERRGSRRGGK